MRATVVCGPGDVRVEQCDAPRIRASTDLHLAGTCGCGRIGGPQRTAIKALLADA